MELHLLLIAVKLIDICTIQTFDGNQLMIIERGECIKESLTETIWKSYALSAGDKALTLKKQIAVFIPHGSDICATTVNGEMYAVQQSNFKNALHLFGFPWDKKGNNTLSVSPNLTKVNINIESGMKVNMPSNGDWSTPFLSTRRCLFNQDILPIGDKKSLIIANTADATAWVFSVNDQKVMEKTSFGNCAEPCLIEVEGSRLLFFRSSPNDWPLFYNLPNTRMGPELLPLKIHRLNGDLAIEETISSLSNGWVTGPSFMFDVCSNNQGVIVLATVVGLMNKPLLQIIISDDKGKTWDEHSSTSLQTVPYHVSVGVTDSRILAVCTFKEHDGFHVMADEFRIY